MSTGDHLLLGPLLAAPCVACHLIFPLGPAQRDGQAAVEDAGPDAGVQPDAGDVSDSGPEAGEDAGTEACAFIDRSTLSVADLPAITVAFAHDRAFVGTNHSSAEGEGSELWAVGGLDDEPRELWHRALPGGFVLGVAATSGHVFAANADGDVEVMALDGRPECDLELPNATDVMVWGTDLFTVASTGRIWRHSGVDGEPCDALSIEGGIAPCDARAVVMVQDRLAVACGIAETVVWVDPDDLTLQGEVWIGGTPSALAVSGSILLVAADEAGVVAVDPASRTVVGRDLGAACGASLPATAVSMHGPNAIILGYDLAMWPGRASLVAVDVSDPRAPGCAGGRQLAGPAWDLVAAGDRAYVAADEAGLVVLDVVCR